MKKAYRPPATGGSKLLNGVEQKLSNLALKSPTLNKMLSFFFMPIAYKGGMKINNDLENFYVEVPPKKFNKNAYGTIAGASILANLELAGGAYLLTKCSSRYRLVCRNVHYSFRLPTTTGLHFKFEAEDEDFNNLADQGKPFNANLKATVYARTKTRGEHGKQVGRGTICFHLWPVPNKKITNNNRQ